MRRPALFTIAPDADFLGTLADRVLDGTLIGDWPREGPFWLTDVTIFLPTRRARLRLAECFSRRGHPLLPDIRSLGDQPGEEEPFLPPVDAPPMPPAASRLERQLTLAQLVEAWARTEEGSAVLASPPYPAEILRLAELMGELIDDITVEGADIGRLDAVLAERDLAENWQQTAKLLSIALTAWPNVLAERGKLDPAELRNRVLGRQAATAALVFGDRPVIAAGSTGSIPATAGLLAAIAGLPRGALVLPGLDTTLSPEEVAALSDEAANPHGHPQYGLVKLLRRLKAHPSEVVELAGPASPRTVLVRRALALAEATGGWSEAHAGLAPAIDGALAGLSILAARNEDHEARAVALAARDGLCRGRTVGIVTPDRALARRIAAELARHNVTVDDSAGTPLFQSPAGRLARQVLAAAVSGFAPVDLMALLRNRAACFGLERQAVRRLADRIDFGLLRGQFPASGVAGLRQVLALHATRPEGFRPTRPLGEADRAAIADLFDRLEAAFAPLLGLLDIDRIAVAPLAEALAAALEAVLDGGDESERPPGFDELGAFLTELAAETGGGPRLAADGLDSVLASLMAGRVVRKTAPHRDDIAIWGELEARLQNADFVIVAGLNEDIWPGPADPGPWLSRSMRLAIGLEPPERRQGLAAHDFMMALGNREVLLAYAQRIGTAPAQPSRFLQRLEAFAGAEAAEAMRARGSRWAEEARRLDAVTEIVPATRPAPKPRAELRPRRLSVTEIETLIRSPYDIYARHVLGLSPVERLGARIGGRERGVMVHKVFAGFIDEGGDFADPDASARLIEMAREAFAALESIPERRLIWLRRFETAAAGFLAYEQARSERVVVRHAEISGALDLDNGFRLTGRADRIDILADGRLAILDFKTGSLPAPRDMKALLAPQLLLEAGLVEAGGFPGIPPAKVAEIGFIKVGLGPAAFVPTPFALGKGVTLGQAIEEVWHRLNSITQALLLDDALPMPPQALPDPNRRWRGDYDHLARADEWLLKGDEP